MTGPRDILRKAAQRQMKTVDHSSKRICAPAPMQINLIPGTKVADQATPVNYDWNADQADTHEEAGQRSIEPHEQVQTTRMPVAQNIGGHAIYRELMRSHDRMGTRHIGPRG